MLGRLAGMHSPEPLRTLADVLEPIKVYERHHSREYTSVMPYNRLVDAVRPASEKARVFTGMVDRLAENRDAVRKQLIAWRDSREALAPLIKDSVLLEEAVPLAQNLSAAAQAGIEAMDYLASGSPAPEAWVKDQLAVLDAAAKPCAELQLMIVPPVRKLIEAAAKGPVQP